LQTDYIARRYSRIYRIVGKAFVVDYRPKDSAVTTKEKVISLIQKLDDNVSLDEVIDRLYLLRKIELGIAQADADDVMEHDAFMDELEAEDART